MMWSLNHSTDREVKQSLKGFLFRATAALLLMISWMMLSEGTTDTGDGVMHYLFARFAPEYPLLYLDHWAKPVFTLLASPFAQYGLYGVCLYNILCSFTAGFFIMMTLRPLGNLLAECAFWATISSPQLFMANFSGLTEPTFALIIAAGIYLASVNKLLAASLLWSFLPLSRTEGFFLLPVFGIYFLSKKNYTASLLLITGSLIFSFAGGIAKGNFLWLIEQNPYKGEAMYGNGKWNHFINHSEYIWGVPGTILLIAGITLPLIFRKKISGLPNIPIWFTHSLVIVFFVLHSVLWWKGLFGSLGLIRVMAAMAPLFALTMVRPLQPLLVKINNTPRKLFVLFSFIALSAFTPIKQFNPPVKADQNLQLIIDCANWLNEKYDDEIPKVVYSYPLFSWVLDVNHFDNSKHIEISGLDKVRPANTLQKGEIVIWDSFFGPGTYRRFEQFSQDTLFKEIKRFQQPDSTGLSIVIFERQ
ncbi:MAG: hypothetical protein RLZZ46_1428 [Bacteroidota bacterium]